MNILFTGGGGAGSEAIFRLLSHKYQIHFADANCTAINPEIPDSRSHQVPLANDHNFINNLLKLCQLLSIDILIPSVDEELLNISRNAMRFDKTKILLPQFDYITLMSDKLSASLFLRNNGINAPKSCSLDDNLFQLNYPCICKPRTGRGSRGVTIVKCAEAAKALKIFYSYASNPDEYVIQEQAFGQEYTVQMISNSNCQLQYVIPVKVRIKKGITINAVIDDNKNVINACEKLHNVIPASGTYNIQLILTDDGRVLPFEINPRISTTLCMAIAAGVDPIAEYLRENSAGSKPVLSGKNLTLARYWYNKFL